MRALTAALRGRSSSGFITRSILARFINITDGECLFRQCCLIQKGPSNLLSLPRASSFLFPRSYYGAATTFPEGSFGYSSSYYFCLRQQFNLVNYHSLVKIWGWARYSNNASVVLKTDRDVVRFSINKPSAIKEKKMTKRTKMSRKAKLNELRFYRLKAKKKMNSPNPEVRMRYKLDKAKRKEVWLIEKLRKYEVPKAPAETYDPEILTEEERHYLKRTGEKKKNYVPVGRRGVFGGVVLNMHLHWKKHETVKVVCRPCKPGQIHEYAEELALLSKGIVIDIKPNNIILFYRGKNYVQPQVMSPPNTLSKQKALEKYRFEQSLEHTSQFIEKLEKELEEYQKHVVHFKKEKEEGRGLTIC